MKCINILLFTVITFQLFAQKEVAVLETNYISDFYSGKESLAIPNDKTGELIILVEDIGKTDLFLLDENFELKGKLRTPSLLSSFKTFLGYSISNTNEVTIFFSNKSKKKFGTLTVNFEKNSISQKKLDIKFKKEKVIDGISHKNEFYILSGITNSNMVNFYHFDTTSKTFKKNEVSFEEVAHKTLDGFEVKPLGLLRKSRMGNSGGMKKIDIKNPNAIETTAEKSKLYQLGDELIFSFDYSPVQTKFLRINTNDFSKKVEEFEKPVLSNTASESSSFQHHNSFLYKGVLYQMKISSKKMKFTAKQFSSKRLLKEIVLNKEDSITFKNGPIIQEGAPNPMFSDRVREFEKTSKFLRKVAKGKTGISVFEYNDMLQIEIGSYKEFKGGGAPMMMPGGFGAIPLGAIGPISMSFNPTFAAYGSYSSSKSTHIKCVFDKKFEHVLGRPYDSIFDEIGDYEEDLKSELQNVFNYDNKTYFSYLSKKDKQYHIVEFE